MREWPASRKRARSVPSVSLTSIATISARGTMTSSTERSSSFKTFCRILRSASEKSEVSALASLSSSTSRSSRTELLRSASSALNRCQSGCPRGAAGAGLEGGSAVTVRSSVMFIRRQGRRSSVGIRIGNAEGCENLRLEPFHFKGLALLDVIIPQDVQESMHHQMGEVIGEGLFKLRRLALEGFPGEDDVAENAGYRAKRGDLGKTQHIGWLVDAAPLAVELLLFGVVGQNDRELADAGDAGARLRQRLEHAAVGERLHPLGPAFGIDGEQNGEGRALRAQGCRSSRRCAARRRSVSAS